ncbi:hypothetical protein AB7160_04240 [Morganella morganii]|uniref:hypothetical protein n=1 Tax=Morganella morganii TaxID=582 RepID=UPI000B32AAB0|nr:hypothetical protein [Morganella morganii]QQO73290.1 hypothetical protein IDH72_03860 [Morganella morganii]
MKNSKKTQQTLIMPDSEQLIRAVVTSTAVETGQEPQKLAEALKEKREKYAHLRLAV